jgi:aryl-alcohol dehydrogenase-like predicted oxidoreductase
MRTRRFGPLDVEVPVVGLGTWNMERDDRASAIAAIRTAIELGLTHLDTAEMYGDGEVERFPKASRSEHVRELATTIELDDAAIAEIERAFPLQPWRGLPTS